MSDRRLERKAFGLPWPPNFFFPSPFALFDCACCRTTTSTTSTTSTSTTTTPGWCVCGTPCAVRSFTLSGITNVDPSAYGGPCLTCDEFMNKQWCLGFESSPFLCLGEGWYLLGQTHVVCLNDEGHGINPSMGAAILDWCNNSGQVGAYLYFFTLPIPDGMGGTDESGPCFTHIEAQYEVAAGSFTCDTDETFTLIYSNPRICQGYPATIATICASACTTTTTTSTTTTSTTSTTTTSTTTTSTTTTTTTSTTTTSTTTTSTTSTTTTSTTSTTTTTPVCSTKSCIYQCQETSPGVYAFVKISDCPSGCTCPGSAIPCGDGCTVAGQVGNLCIVECA